MAHRDRQSGGAGPVTCGRLLDGSLEERQNQVYRKLIGVMDPELGLSIVKLGLVYDIGVDGGAVTVTMTLTTPACPLGEMLRRDVTRVVGALPWVTAVDVRIVWEPRWTPAMIR
jgi:metal-sulfur cluster biosynthetic enzyme